MSKSYGPLPRVLRIGCLATRDRAVGMRTGAPQALHGDRQRDLTVSRDGRAWTRPASSIPGPRNRACIAANLPLLDAVPFFCRAARRTVFSTVRPPPLAVRVLPRCAAWRRGRRAFLRAVVQPRPA